MRFSVNGVAYQLDTAKITFAEGKAVERACGRTMAEIERTKADDLATMQAMVWIAMKRQDPTLTFTDLDDMPVGDIDWHAEEEVQDPEGGGEADPTPGPDGDGEGSRSTG